MDVTKAQKQKLIGTPDQVFHGSKEIETFLKKVIEELGAGKRKIKPDTEMPEDFIENLKKHCYQSDWDVYWDETEKEFRFQAIRKNFFGMRIKNRKS